MAVQEITDQTANFILRWQMFDALLFHSDIKKDTYIVGSVSGSELTFPNITRAMKTGSRAERVYLDDSDVDFMYEVGPLLVEPDSISQSMYKLFCEKSNHVGFYRIKDNTGKHLYPKDIQIKVAPMIKLGKEVIRSYKKFCS